MGIMTLILGNLSGGVLELSVMICLLRNLISDKDIIEEKISF